MRMEGVEPSRIAPPASEAGASPSSATSARASTPTPGPPVGTDEELVDGRAVGLVAELRRRERGLQVALDLVDLGHDLGEVDLAAADGHDLRSLRLGQRQREPARLEELEALVAEPQRVHRVLRV